jgi:K+-transporting ATPase ATPase C chain
MKQHILPAFKLTLISLITFSGLYTLLIWLIAQAAPNRGDGETVSANEKLVGYALEGQSFTKDNYFWSRPSAVAYNAAGSGASNKGPFNPDYLKDLKSRVDSFLIHNPSVQKKDIPSDLLTASASGLDPDLSLQGAYVQIARIAKARKINEEKIRALVNHHIQNPFLGMFGTEKVNVLKMNIDLDKLN